MKDDELVLFGVGILLWIAAIAFVLMGIWMPSWQWTATSGVAIVVGFLFMVGAVMIS